MAFGAIAGAAGSIFGGWLSQNSARKAADLAWKRSKIAYKHRYQWQVDDMQAAGLNPMLAMDVGAGSAPHAPVAEAGQLGAGVGAATAKGLAAATARASLQNTEANTGKTIAEDFESRERRMKVEQEIENVKANTAETLARIPQVPAAQKAAIARDTATSALNSAKAANERAGLPMAEFEGQGGKIGVDAVKAIIQRGSSAKAARDAHTALEKAAARARRR